MITLLIIIGCGGMFAFFAIGEYYAIQATGFSIFRFLNTICLEIIFLGLIAARILGNTRGAQNFMKDEKNWRKCTYAVAGLHVAILLTGLGEKFFE